MRRKTTWIKIMDRNGETYEYEGLYVEESFGRLIIFENGPLGELKHTFMKRNLISYSILPAVDRPEDE